MKERFELRDIYLSNAILGHEDLIPYKLLNLTVRVNMEEVPYSLKDHKWTTHEELAEIFAKTMKEAFLKHCKDGPSEDQERVKLLAMLPHPVTEKAGEKEFGWYRLNEEKNVEG